MFNRTIFENSLTHGIPVLEVVGGLEQEQPSAQAVVPLKRSELGGEIMGPLAGLRLTQYFGYSSEECDKVLEALYRFPLPGDAAVSNVRVRFGEVEIVAELKEREQAEAEYEEAKQQGRQAALATRESPNVFTLRVAGIQPDQEVMVETSYVQLAKAEGSNWTLRIPLTTAPRFVREDELNSRHAQGQPLAVLRDPGHRFALNVTIHQVHEIYSPTHKLDLNSHGEQLTVRLADGEVLPDRDCVLHWHPAQAEKRPTLHVMLHDDQQAEQLYFLALVAPPATHDYGRGVPREVTLLVDHSGSMSGAKWEAADWTVERFLSDLTEQDAFALGLFHTRTKWWARDMTPANAKTVNDAITFLKNNKDSGGTNLGVALEQALDVSRVPDMPARHVLVVTDAQVTDAARVLRLADEEAKRQDKRRISVICVDAAPNDFLASELAARGGGVSRFLTSNPNEGDITTALDQVLADWAEPVLANLKLEVNRSGLESTDRENGSPQAGWSYVDLGDLPAGRAVWVSGRMPRGEGPLTFRLTAHKGNEVATSELDLAQAGDHRALKALFGTRRILGLEFLINSGYSGQRLHDQLRRLGYDPKKAMDGSKPSSKVYAENVRKDAQKGLRGLLVRESLNYGLASAETAFIAVRTEEGKPVEGSVAVANALPSGWSNDFLMASAAPMAMRSMSMTRGGGHAKSRRRRGGTRGMSNFRSLSIDADDDMMVYAAPAPPAPPAALEMQADEGILPAEPIQSKSASEPSPEPSRSEQRSTLQKLIGYFKNTLGVSDDQPQTSSKPVVPQPSSPPAPVAPSPAQAQPPRGANSNTLPLFSGVPQHSAQESGAGQIVLFDSTQQAASSSPSRQVKLSGIQVYFPDGSPAAHELDRDLTLLLFVGDLSQPRAQVRLADLVRMRGKRPLNLIKQAGDPLRLVLSDPNGAWKTNAPRIEITLQM
ncbi:MAG: VIT and vWA domain-containing protein [Ardenticatenaceae bacterium]